MATQFKYKNEWLDSDEVLTRRRAEVSKPAVQAPLVDVAALPERGVLDPDVPLEQLFFERPEVRSYITKDGQIRSGLTTAQRTLAEEIFKKYGGKA